MVPFTSGAKLTRRKESRGKQEPGQSLVERSENNKIAPLITVLCRTPKIKLTREFQDLLSDIYTKVDLDGNGTLSR